MSTDQYGKVEMEGDRASLVFERQLRHSPERVWDALTDDEELGAWYMAEARIDGRPGGSVDMVTGPARFHWTGKILAWEPHRVFEYEFNTGVGERMPFGEQSVVRYELIERDGGTLLRLRHSRLTQPTAVGFAPGTHALLDRLEAHLAAEKLPGWLQRYDDVKSGYPQMDLPA
jgi:uncharacterized protein YndB with AHSA1/START domain